MKKTIITALVAVVTLAASGQTAWTLDSCITYAQQQSYAVMRANLAAKNAEIAKRSASVSMTPTVNAGVSENFSFGLAQGADNVKKQRQQASTGFNASTSMPLFTGLRITNQIRRTRTDYQAALLDIEGVKEDIELNVMSYYLSALYYKDLVEIQKEQLVLSEKQLKETEILVESGRKAESELYEIRAQEAQKQQSLTEAENNYKMAILDLCQLINYKEVELFAVTPIEAEADTEVLIPDPDNVYAQARENRAKIKSQEKRIESAKFGIKEAQAEYYPQLSLSASWGTGYYHIFNNNNPAFGQQFVNNGSEVVGFSLSIPIYNRLQVRNSVCRQKVALEQANIDHSEMLDKLYKEIQTAYYNALASKEKLSAAKRSREASEKAYEYAVGKYELGRMSAYEYNEVQTRMQRAELEESQAKYDYILRLKILNYYMR